MKRHVLEVGIIVAVLIGVAFLTVLLPQTPIFNPAEIPLVVDKIVVEKIVEVKNIVEVKPPSIADIIPEIRPGVVHLQAPAWQGSGFVVGPYHIITARHCVKDVEKFLITTQNKHQLNVTRAISNKNHDVASVWIDDLTCVNEDVDHRIQYDGKHKVDLHILKLGSITECQLGQEIITIGSPYGQINFNSVTLGVISGLDRDYDPLNQSYYGEHDYGWSVAFQTDSPGHPGNSGGAVFTADGVVRGILVGGFSPSLIIAMPVDLFLEDLALIERMFRQDNYYFEQEPDYAADAWGY